MKSAALLLIILLIPLLSAGDTQVSLSTSHTRVTIADRITIKCICKTTPEIDEIRLILPSGEFELLDQKPLSLTKNEVFHLFEKHFDITYFKTGTYSIGPLQVDLIKESEVVESKQTNSLNIEVLTSLVEEDTDIKPLKDPVEISGNPFFVLKYVLLATALLLLLFLIVYLIRKKRRLTTIKEAPDLSPINELEFRWTTLIGKKLTEKGRYKEFFTLLVQIIKDFLKRQYAFNAEDMTTSETMSKLDLLENNPEILNAYTFIFNQADLVKFAKFIPDQEKLNLTFDSLRNLIHIYRETEKAAAAATEEKRSDRNGS